MTSHINIKAKDLQRITGFSLKVAYEKMNLIRKKLQKDKNQLITVEEVSAFFGIKPESVIKALENIK